ncbi:MAG: glycerophosphodiester phosphodiesterase family protein [Bacteroidales bacterium]|nr:glycerophosphodiester phosphodiesterase family protein [Bacteroidales bacterium]
MNWKERIVYALFGLTALTAYGQTRVIAHRGYWDCAGGAQNSLASLREAARAGVYGSEFDVQLTKDSVAVVNHDDDIEGRVISETDYPRLQELRLKNGEVLPTLDAYLAAGKEQPGVQLILEIKPHKTEQEENTLVRLIVDRVKALGMERQVEYISFSLNVCRQLAARTPSSSISYLRSDKAPEELKALGINGIDYHYKVLEEKPEWVAEAHRLGMTVNAWTVNDDARIRRLAEGKVDFITTDRPVDALRLLKGTADGRVENVTSAQ